MPGGYGTRDTDWGTAGTTSPVGSYSAPSGGSGLPGGGGGSNVQEGSNAVADAINAARGAPPQLSFAQDLQNKAQLAIAQENIHKGIGKYAGQFPEYDVEQPMGTGFGSVFGASSGSTASSETVQDSLNFMIEDTIDQWQKDKGGSLSAEEHNQAVSSAMANFYPKIDQMTLEEYLMAAGLDPNNPNSMNSPAYQDWLAANASTVPGYANLMGIPEGHIGIEDFWTVTEPSWDSWGDPWDYGWGDYGNIGADSLADLARQTWFSESLGDVIARQEERQKEGLGPAGMRASEMERMYDKEFAAKASPLFDPEFSLGVYEDIDPMYAGMDLFRKSRLETA
jgi:hypothetical protein